MGIHVIESWRYGNRPVDERGSYVHVVALDQGLLARLLRLFKVEPGVRIAIGLDRLEVTERSLTGSRIRIVPLECIAATLCGQHAPWHTALAVLAGFGVAGLGLGLELPHTGGWIMGLALTALGGIVALAIGLSSRTLQLSFIENSGQMLNLSFKPSVIEGVRVNEEEVRQLCKVVHRLIEAKHRRRHQASG